MNRDIVDGVRRQAHAAVGAGEATAASAKEGVLEAVARVSEIFRAVRDFGLEDMLGTVGLQRRQGPGLALGMFGAGMACGAVLGAIFAPQSGRDSRRMIGERVSSLLKQSEDKVEKTFYAAADKAKDAAHTATDKAKDVAHTATDKAKDVIHDVEGVAKDAAASVERGFDTATTKLHLRRGSDDMKSTNGTR